MSDTESPKLKLLELFKNIVKLIQPTSNWNHLIQYGKEGYTTNVPKEDVDRDDVFNLRLKKEKIFRLFVSNILALI